MTPVTSSPYVAYAADDPVNNGTVVDNAPPAAEPAPAAPVAAEPAPAAPAAPAAAPEVVAATPKAEETTPPAVPSVLTDDEIRAFVNAAIDGMKEQLKDGFQFGDIMWLADFTMDWMQAKRLEGKVISIEEAKGAVKMLVEDVLNRTLPIDLDNRQAVINVLVKVAARIIDLTSKFDDVDASGKTCWQRFTEKMKCC